MFLLRPVPDVFPITQKYGENPAWYPTTNGHNGIDYGVPEGTIVLAAADGEVQRVDLDAATAADPKKGYGYHVRIRHKDGSLTIYAHFQPNAFLVATGDVLKMGQPIGMSGNTGFSTGPHLHFELRTGLALTNCVDPTPFIVREPPCESALLEATITPSGDWLNIRSGPSKHAGIRRQLRSGQTVMVYGLAGPDVWLQIEEGYIKYDPAWEEIRSAAPAGSGNGGPPPE